MVSALPEDLMKPLLARLSSAEPCDFALPNQARPAPPLAPRMLDEAERELGLTLPAAVRDLYGRVANGGIGPGYGLIGLLGGVKSDMSTDVIEDYRLRLLLDDQDPAYFWPEGVLPVCHWGCAIYSCIDSRTPEARVLRFDPNPVDEDWSAAWGIESDSLSDWLRRWVDGDELFEAGTPDGSFVIER